jgi:hypothetical protein
MSALGTYLIFFAIWVLSWIGLHMRRGLADTHGGQKKT